MGQKLHLCSYACHLVPAGDVLCLLGEPAGVSYCNDSDSKDERRNSVFFNLNSEVPRVTSTTYHLNVLFAHLGKIIYKTSHNGRINNEFMVILNLLCSG